MGNGSGLAPASMRRNALANLLGRIVSAFLWIGVTPFTLAHLGVERFGVWSLFFALGGYLGSLDLGMSQSVARFVALGLARGDSGGVRDVIRRSLVLGGAMGAMWCALFMALRGLFLDVFHVPAAISAEVLRSLFVFSFSMLAFSLTQVLHGVLQGAQRMDRSNTYVLVGLLVHAGILVLGLAAGHGLVAAAAAMLTGHVVSGLLALATVRPMLIGSPASVVLSPVSWREMIGFGGTVQLTGAFALGWLQAGRVLLGSLGSMAWVTLFELGMRVAYTASSLPQLIQSVAIPAAAKASAANDPAELARVYHWTCRWVFLVGGVLLCGLVVVGPAVVRVWLGGGHEASGRLVQILAAAFLCMVVPGPATAIARGAGMPRLEATGFAIAFGAQILLCVLLIPRFGPSGAAVATGLSIALGGGFVLVVLHRRLGIPLFRWLAVLVAPRIVLPLAVALVVSAAGLGGALVTRGDAMRAVAVQGGLFLAAVLLLTLPTGDLRHGFLAVRQRLLSRGAGGVA